MFLLSLDGFLSCEAYYSSLNVILFTGEYFKTINFLVSILHILKDIKMLFSLKMNVHLFREVVTVPF